ncbi:hypothetical protein [Spongiactinospora sp. TRM90649]|uniref:hypothetical protein n=1 Tax=Spongiactinospora sp. TRM90649 TaxID=3031114 RepID=UPI0023F9B290|nr:hypothetical protein [Spongiactinospora sp. TRM90649]MDF5756456.1 hypothetical protein [Spongiactinospora sp. TRM90649]
MAGQVIDGGRNDVIESGPRRRWSGLVVTGVLVALVGIPVVGLLANREPAEPPPQPSRPLPSSPAPVSEERRANYLLPKTSRSGDRRILHVTFPDGTRARVSYPAGVTLAEFGVRPAIGVRAVEGGPIYPLVAPLLGQNGSSAGGPMLRRLTDDVGLWPKRAVRGRGYLMVFDFGKWTISLSDPIEGGPTFEQRMDLAQRLHGRTDKRGYLVLRAGDPVRLARPDELIGSVTFGPQLWFGGGTRPLVVFVLSPDCGADSPAPPRVDARRYVAVACKGDVQVAVVSGREYADRLLSGLRIELI